MIPAKSITLIGTPLATNVSGYLGTYESIRHYDGYHEYTENENNPHHIRKSFHPCKWRKNYCNNSDECYPEQYPQIVEYDECPLATTHNYPLSIVRKREGEYFSLPFSRCY